MHSIDTIADTYKDKKKGPLTGPYTTNKLIE